LIFIVATSFLDPKAKEETWLFMGITGLVVSVVVWVNQRLSIRPVDSKDKNLVIQCIVFFLIPTVGMLLAKGYSINVNLSMLIFYPISIFVTYRLSQFLAKKEGN
jgi:uncharacterized membrane protein YqaE (UPF0057 family)